MSSEKDTTRWLMRYERRIVSAIVILFITFAIGFSLGPIFEAPDEPSHFIFTRNLIIRRALPDPVEHINVQDHQAPLYYALLIPPTLVLDDLTQPLELPKRNPFWGAAFDKVGNDNKNLRLHSADEQFPYTQNRLALTIHVLRLFSVVLGAITVLATYASARMIWPDRADLRILSTALVAFWPQFAWLSGMLNNDNMLITLSSVSLYLTLRQLRDGPNWRHAVIHGVLLGAALLTKASAVFLAIPVAAGVLLDRRSWKFAPVTAGIALVLSGWWYVRNIELMHSLAGWPPLDDRGYIRPGELAFDVAFARMPFAYQGFWARFGNVSVPVSPAIYRFFDVLSIFIIVGLLVWIVNAVRSVVAKQTVTRTVSEHAVVIAFTLAGFLGLLVNAATLYTGNQGRYALAGITGFAMLFAAGALEWLTHRIRTQISLSAIPVWVAVLAVCLFGFFYPSYQPTQATGQIPAEPMFRFENAVELLDIAPDRINGRPGESVTISLTWRALGPTESDLVTYIHSIDSEIVRRDSYPATGNLKSTDWAPGQVWVETFHVEIPADAQEQSSYFLLVGLYDADTERQLAALNNEGDELTPVVGRLSVNSEVSEIESRYKLGDTITLGQPIVERTEDSIRVCLNWNATALMDTNYHVFIHVLDAGPDPLVQADFEPLQGRYPTGAWEVGESINECVELDSSGVPDSGWRIAIGMYDIQSLDRLPVSDLAGNHLEGAMVVIDPGKP